MQKGMIKVEGLHSNQDRDKVLLTLNEVWGIQNAEVNLQKGEVTFNYDERAASEQDFEAAIIDTGFKITK